MNRSHFHEAALYRAANGVILACIGLFTPYFGISAVTWKNILVLGVVLALLVGVSLLPARGKVLCLLFAAISIVVSAAAAGWSTSNEFLQAYFQWCMGYVGEQEKWMVGFQLVHTVAVTAVAFLVQLLTEKIRAAKNFLAGVAAGVMLFCLIAQISLTHMNVVFLFLFIVVVFAEWVQSHWKKNGSGELKARMVWLAPFLGVYLLLMAAMPAPQDPYDWYWAKNLYRHIKESVLVVTENLFHGGREDFSTALSGFSEEGELGGSVRSDDREVMYIQAQSDLVTNLYLIGKVYDAFDGRQWKQEIQDDDGERFIDTVETLYAVRRADDEYRRDYLRETRFQVHYESFRSQYIFAPLKARNITGSQSDLKFSFKGGDLISERRLGYGTEYNIAYYQMNTGTEIFDRLLETPPEPDEALWLAISADYEKQTSERITLEMVESHRQKIYDNYLDNVTLSKGVEDYLSGITREAKTDLERLRAIERELHSYTYTRSPGDLPDIVTSAGEFLDYFLLESRQGYCLHFATAFVLLARAEGFPARYVQGFCVPMKGNREASVLASMAHSWPEVYIEEVGWIPFEPTPGYGSFRYTPWGVANRDIPDPEEAGRNEEEKLDGTGGTNASGSGVDAPEDHKETDGEAEDRKAEEESGLRRLWRTIAFSLPIIAAGFVLVLLLDNLLGMYRYRKMSPLEKLKLEIRKNLRVLSWLGLKRGELETLQELRERGRLKPGLTTLRFIEDYEDVLYGTKKAEEEVLERIKKERGQLLGLLRREKRAAYGFYVIRIFLTQYR